jgi:hypothetical protein
MQRKHFAMVLVGRQRPSFRDRDQRVLRLNPFSGTSALPPAMSYNLKGILVSPYSRDGLLKSTPEECKGLLSNFDVDNSELRHYEDEEYAEPRERTPLRKRRIARIVGGIVALILGAMFLAPMSRMWCGGMDTTNRSPDPSRLLSNGTHEFKHTVLIVSLDGFR